MSFAAAIQRDIELQATQRRPSTFCEVSDVINYLRTFTEKPPPPFALDMFVVAREEFYGGWVLWLGNEEAATISPELRARVPSMRSDTKAKFLFRLSLWTKSNNSRPGNTNAFDVTEILDGTEVFVTRVTGAKLYEEMAQGNANRVEPIVDVEVLVSSCTDVSQPLPEPEQIGTVDQEMKNAEATHNLTNVVNCVDVSKSPALMSPTPIQHSDAAVEDSKLPALLVPTSKHVTDADTKPVLLAQTQPNDVTGDTKTSPLSAPAPTQPSEATVGHTEAPPLQALSPARSHDVAVGDSNTYSLPAPTPTQPSDMAVIETDAPVLKIPTPPSDEAVVDFKNASSPSSFLSLSQPSDVAVKVVGDPTAPFPSPKKRVALKYTGKCKRSKKA